MVDDDAPPQFAGFTEAMRRRVEAADRQAPRDPLPPLDMHTVAGREVFRHLPVAVGEKTPPRLALVKRAVFVTLAHLIKDMASKKGAEAAQPGNLFPTEFAKLFVGFGNPHRTIVSRPIRVGIRKGRIDAVLLDIGAALLDRRDDGVAHLARTLEVTLRSEGRL